MWPFNREQPSPEPQISEETRELRRRTERLAEVIQAQGVETRAVAREAEHVRQTNHFAVALITAMSALPKEKHS